MRIARMVNLKRLSNIPEDIPPELFKTKKRKRNKPTPLIKWCKNCNEHRVRYHHRLCNFCWDELHKTPQEKKEDTTEF